jgi:uncharacterized protein YceH (UPF0502 family)
VEPLSPEAIRILGCLVEKEATVPAAYPLSLNAVRQACNQTSSRDPVVQYDEITIQRSLDTLKAEGWVRFVHPSHGERATKFRHVVEEKLGIDGAALAVLSVLALRGPQTSGELRTRTERQQRFETPDEVDALLEALAAREEPLVVEVPRVPGQHQTRWAHLLGGPVDLEALAADVSPRTGGAGSAGLAERVVELEVEVARLRSRLDGLEAALGVESVSPLPD